MREPKYQAWHTEHKKMYRVQGWTQGDYGLQHLTVYCIDEDDGIECFTECFTGNQVELREYTGVTDCQGQNIYEGDIVSIEHTAMLITPGTIGVVSYVNGRYVVDTHAHTHGLNVFVDRRYRRYGKPVIEVVGNVWEHPGLAPKK